MVRGHRRCNLLRSSAASDVYKKQPNEENGLLDYYQLLYKHYQDWYDQYDYSPKMKISTDQLDISNPEDWNQVYKEIQQQMELIGLNSKK